jgi:DNA-binding NarL/FixJ family response regulator
MSQSLNPQAAPVDRDERRRSLISVDALADNHTSEKAVIGVLVAYDDKFACMGLRGLLKSERDIAALGCATDPDEAVALARQVQPDVMLVHIALPGGSVELTRRLAVERAVSGVHVLILGVSDQDEAVFSSLPAGHVDSCCATPNRPR